MTLASPYFIGLMSGTSLDAIDAVIVDFSDTRKPRLIASKPYPIPPNLKSELLALTQAGDNEIERMGRADRLLGSVFAKAVNDLLKTADLRADQIAAIGSHGQTIRHRPASETEASTTAFTLQIGDPNTIALETGITTVADFRRKDIAAGGQGAPLAPALHAQLFGSDKANRAVINIGGMSNITYLPIEGEVLGFDTGPGNVLMDAWINLHQGAAFDNDGRWAAQGTVIPALSAHLLALPFFNALGTVSTGREDFCLEMLQGALNALPELAKEKAENIQATLLEFTACAIAKGLAQAAQEEVIDQVYICGGGAFNQQLMQRLAVLLAPAKLSTTQDLGIPPEWVEGVAFAWLAKQTLNHLTGNLPSVTGAKRDLILGGVFSAH